MNPDAIFLSYAQVDEIRAHAEHAYPAECCGLLIGSGELKVTVSVVVPAANLAESPDRFSIDPQVQFEWLKRLRGSEMRILGHYHSHPNGVAHPSAVDAEMAHDPDMVWVIIPIVNGKAGHLCAYAPVAEPAGFETVSLVIEPVP